MIFIVTVRKAPIGSGGQGVAGSNPAAPTIQFAFRAPRRCRQEEFAREEDPTQPCPVAVARRRLGANRRRLAEAEAGVDRGALPGRLDAGPPRPPPGRSPLDQTPPAISDP